MSSGFAQSAENQSIDGSATLLSALPHCLRAALSTQLAHNFHLEIILQEKKKIKKICKRLAGIRAKKRHSKIGVDVPHCALSNNNDLT